MRNPSVKFIDVSVFLLETLKNILKQPQKNSTKNASVDPYF
jgi:hypothetical protein